MSTETPDAEAAWETYAYDPATKELRPAIVYREKVAFMAGRESLSARLDALHAENQRLRERGDNEARLRELGKATRSEDALNRLRAERAAARAERDALRAENKELNRRLDAIRFSNGSDF